MKAEEVLRVGVPLEEFRPGDFVQVCWPHDCDYPDTYLVVGGYTPSDSLRLVSARNWMVKNVSGGIVPMRFDSVDVDVYERDKRLNAPR